MTNYVALLRGFNPLNPNMRNEKLRGVFKDLGFRDVQTVISSGNVLFKTQSRNVEELEAVIEEALLLKLGFTSTIIIRSKAELELLVDKKPFEGMKDLPESRFNVTFLKNEPTIGIEFPYHAENEGYIVLGIYDRAICSVIDTTRSKTPDLMRWLENEFGKEITTRTWKTVGRILKRMNE